MSGNASKTERVGKYDMLELALYYAMKLDPEEKHKQVLKAIEELISVVLPKLEQERDAYASF